MTKFLPEHYQEWHPSKNPKDLDEYKPFSKYEAFWRCNLGHEWQARIAHRMTYKTGCPICANKILLPGFNDLATKHPNLVPEWSTSNTLKPNELVYGSGQKAEWVCSVGHHWEDRISNRTLLGRGCPYCCGSRRVIGKTDLQTTHPHLAEEYSAKNTREFTTLSPQANYKAIWECEQKHVWQASVAKRTKGSGCPYCSNQKVLSGFNDFYTLNPDSPLLREWSKKPSNLKPIQVVAKSNKTITWVCKVNHEWEARLNERLRGSGCPYCANKKILLGYNDLPTTHPDLASQWSTKNLTPASEVISGSEVKAWWMGACGHEWQASVYKRTKGQGCPVCRDYVSTPEKELASHLTKLGVKVIKSDRKILKGRELDLYLPDVKIAIEYNGLYWHTEDRGKTRWYHHAKWEDCKQQGIQLIQIWEDDWNRNPELVKRMIDRKIGISKEKTVYARTCEVVQVTIQESQAFMEENHIQGWTNGSSYLALKPKGSTNIVALLIVKKEPGTSGKVLNIMRYATSCKVPGGFTKLLKAAEQLWKPEKVITFSDNTVSTGELYAKTGFVADKILEPDYQYLAGGVRKHKFGYRLKKFREDPTLQYLEGLTERELALLNNLPRIWDAGKTRWSKTVSL